MQRRAMFAAAGLPLVAGLGAEKVAAQGLFEIKNARVPLNAIADGASHPLSSRFHTLEEARKAYPHAEAMSDEIDWCALQAAIHAAEAQGGGAVYVPNTGRSYILNRKLTVNPNRVTLRGEGTTLDFGTMHDSDCAILMNADGAPMYGHERFVFEGFELVGPGRGPHVAGFMFQTDTEGLSSRSQIRDCTIHNFMWGILFGNRAYGIGFDHVSVFDCAFCVHAPYGLHDAGETISFSQCYLFNSYCLISNPCGFDMKFFACSLDYCGRIIWDNNGGIDLVGCRLEIAPPTDPAIHCNGGRVNMFGGFFLINGSHDAVHAPELFALSNPSASVHMFGVLGWNWRTTTGRLTNGPGKIRWYEGTEINEAPPGIGHP